ncbi:GyrI-like domain-containing protein [Neobacillus jeddahensis]|uniref:GyrI-like domain-containing protein n=1 Tax=Neobacillus jeddahensis TaxID=1461580 RepID=UPI00058DB0E2|nr:GyrI-like domain-containing protein [Neobacillus jeddahensis]
MTEKVDYKKTFKSLYIPKAKPEIIDVPSMKFIMVEGTGDPNGPEFGQAVEALFTLSYAVKMSYKSTEVPPGYYEYTVFPLEGIWDLVDLSMSERDKNNFKYTLMIRQPDFLTNVWFETFLAQTKKKKPNSYLDKVMFSEMTDGLCCQMLHKGSYDDEPVSFELMEKFCEEQGYIRISKTHREIYLSDPRRTDREKLKTVLRFKITK